MAPSDTNSRFSGHPLPREPVALASEQFFSAASGEATLLETVNDTSLRRAMHVHGHHFQVLNASSSSTKEGSSRRDTFLIDPE